MAAFLIRRIISLIARFNSLLGRNKFPVPMRREFRHNTLEILPNFEPLAGGGRLRGPELCSKLRLTPNRGREADADSRADRPHLSLLHNSAKFPVFSPHVIESVFS